MSDSTGVPLQCAAGVLPNTAPVVAVGHFLHVHSHHVPGRRSAGEPLVITATFVTVFSTVTLLYRAMQYWHTVL
jgi:hypothetical protein